MRKFLKIIWYLLSTAFSGFGTAICKNNFKKSPKKNIVRISKKEIKNDMAEIQYSIAHPISTNQKAVSIHYFHKYKYLFLTEDVDILNKQFDSQNQDYNSILNTLLGLIESIK